MTLSFSGKKIPNPRIYICLVTQLCPTLCDPRNCSPPGSSVHGDSPGKNTGVGCHALHQKIFPNQGLNPGLPHCRWILYGLSHQGSLCVCVCVCVCVCTYVCIHIKGTLFIFQTGEKIRYSCQYCFHSAFRAYFSIFLPYYQLLYGKCV